MRDVYIPDRDVGHLAQRTNVSARGGLILGGEQNAEAGLAEASPAVFHKIRLDKHANRILEFKVILDDEGMAVRSADEVRVARHPLPRFPEVIVQDFDVGGGQGGRSAAKQDGLARGFQEIVLDLEGTILGVADASGDRMSVGASPTHCDAMEIAEIGIDDRYVGHATEAHAKVSFILRRSMQP